VVLPEPQDQNLLIEKALAGDPACVRALVDRLTPVISRRVAAVLWLRKGKRSVAQEVADLSQDVFLALFQSNGKALRAWDSARGMSLDGFVGLLAQHQVISILRSGRTSPWREDPTEIEELDRLGRPAATPEAVVASRESLRVLLDRLRETLSPRGLELFQRIIVDEESVDHLIATTGLTSDAIYQWKTRLLRTIRSLSAEIGTPALSENVPTVRIVKGAPQS
jgi:DNA-directed RNA polymerase specialized sigma24 family protein